MIGRAEESRGEQIGREWGLMINTCQTHEFSGQWPIESRLTASTVTTPNPQQLRSAGAGWMMPPQSKRYHSDYIAKRDARNTVGKTGNVPSTFFGSELAMCRQYKNLSELELGSMTVPTQCPNVSFALKGSALNAVGNHGMRCLPFGSELPMCKQYKNSR
jgi:hypothetical protein